VILGTNIEINASTGTLTTAEGPACPYGVVQPGCVAHDVQRVVTAGVGRALGFNMIANPDSTMFHTIRWGELRQRAIDPGTLQGICDIYPRGQQTPGCPPPAVDPLPEGPDEDPDGEETGCGCTSTGSPLWGFLGLALLLGLSRQRPRSPAARRD
jgi:MYXO-CTERM domain-containing protein